MIDVIEEKDINDPIDLEYPSKVYIPKAIQLTKDKEMGKWISENLTGKWTYRNQGESFLFHCDEKDVRRFPELFVYTFENDDEAVAFKLRWL